MKTRVRAIIITDEKLLLIHRIKGKEEYWVYPGGGLEKTDISDQDGLARECLEELGVNVEVNDLFTEIDNSADKGQIERFYRCQILSGELGSGNGPEFQPGSSYEGMYALEWVSLGELAQKDVKPEIVKNMLLS